MSRICKLGVAVGKKGIGKTYQTTQMMKEYVRGGNGIKPRRVLILDVNDEFEEFRAMRIKDIEVFSIHPKIEIRRIRPFKDDGTRMTLRDIADTLYIILEKYRGGLLLIEDINKYISDHLPNDLVGAICTNRHTNTDIIMLGVFTDAGAQALLSLPEGGTLKRVSIHYNYVTKEMLKQLEALEVSTDTSKPSYMDEDEEWRFVAVGE